ncbi:YihY family inner membrane protein [Parahaliea aestuarii]
MRGMDALNDKFKKIWPRIPYVAQRFGADRCSDNAAALTYMSLFALVPLMTVLYTMASAVPAFTGLEARMQDLMFEHLLPDTSTELEAYLEDFSRQAKNLTGFGIVFLVVTAVLMLRNIERAFNLIWRTGENRSALSSFLIYWAVLSLAPITIGLALGIPGMVAAAALFVEDYDVIGVTDLLLQLTPLLLTAAGFTLLYVTVPNCRVPFRHALAGGFLAAVAFNLSRTLFAKLVAGSSITFIYGAFAAVPLFLLWIYLSWIIVLLGGIFVHSLSSYQSSDQAARPTALKALDVLYLFWSRQRSGRPVRELELLSGRIKVVQGLDSETWRNLREIFMQHNLIAQDQRGNYFLCRDLHTISFWQVKEWVNAEHALDREDIEAQLDWQQRAYKMLRDERRHQREHLNMNLVELFEE